MANSNTNTVEFYFKLTTTGQTFSKYIDLNIKVSELRQCISYMVELTFNITKYHIIVAGQPGDEDAPCLDEYIFQTLNEYFGNSIGSVAFYIRPY